MTSLSAVVSITVALLGGPQGLPFTMEGPYGRIGVSPSVLVETLGPDGARIVRRLAGPGYGSPLQGDKMMYDAAAGLTTIVGPDEATIRSLVEENGGSKAAILRPIIEGGLYTWPERQFEFLWPEDRPQYYLEKLPGLYLGYPVYGRIELQVEFANKTLSGGKYDETIRAFVGRPTLIKAIVTATAPLTSGQKTLLVWQPQPQVGQSSRVTRLILQKQMELDEARSLRTSEHPDVRAIEGQVEALATTPGGGSPVASADSPRAGRWAPPHRHRGALGGYGASGGLAIVIEQYEYCHEDHRARTDN